MNVKEVADGRGAPSSVQLAPMVLMWVLASCASAPVRPASLAHDDYAYAKQHLSWLIQQEMSKHDVTALSIALVDDQQVVWARGFGFADLEQRVPASAETVYRVGSITKLFTGTAAMQLAERGQVDIDSPLATYLPGFSIKSRFPEAGPITPRTLMTHHSGLPADRFQGARAKDAAALSSVASELGDEYVANPPNLLFAYSNLGVSLLGAMVSQVSGLSFATAIDQALLQPLGMRHSVVSALPEAPLLAKPYRDGRRSEEPGSWDVPAGGLCSSVIDLSRFLQMVFAEGTSGGQRLLAPQTLAEMLRAQNTEVPLDLGLRIGLNWFLEPMGIEDAGPAASHGGDTPNFHSQLIALPRHKLGVIVLSNSASSGETVRRVATTAMKLALETKTGLRQPPSQPPSEAEAPMPPEERQALVGDYATLSGLLKVTDEAGQLRAVIAGKSARVAGSVDGRFQLKFTLWGLFPVDQGRLSAWRFSRANIGGRELLIATAEGKSRVFGEKVASAPLPPALAAFLGGYEPTNLAEGERPRFMGLRLEYRDGHLTADLARGPEADGVRRFVLVPVASDEAVIAGLGRGLGETFRFATVNGSPTVFYSGFEFKRRAAARP